MISIFNRIQLATTSDELQRQKIVAALRKNEISYKMKIKNSNAYAFRPTAVRGYTGSYGVHEKSRFKYIFYVNKNDYEWTKQIIYTECNL